jgi:ESS family glutamate:Na+ symporter
LVGLVYVITYGLVKWLGGFLPPEEAKIIWGFFFFFGLFIALLVRWMMERVGLGQVMDPGLQRRISGWSVDFLILSAMAGIQVAVVWKYILPISLMAFLSGLGTLAVVLYLGRRLWSYNLERMAAILGTVTGTVPCGLLLLRILDPGLKSPVVIDLAVMNLFAVPVIGACTYIVNAPLLWEWSVGLTVLVFVLITGVSFGLIKILGLLGKPKF